MPQMAPMSWLMLFLFFTIMLITFNTINYYLFIPKITTESSTQSIQSKSKNWKW